MSHLALCADAEYEPGLHSLSSPRMHEVPAAHVMQSSASSIVVEPSPLVPAGHGFGVDAPVSQYEPTVHARQPVAPVSFW